MYSRLGCRPQNRPASQSTRRHHGRLNEELITGMWDDLLRVAASVKGGHATAALVVGELCSSKRQQNALAAAIKEYGALRRTIYAARYLADETYRRRISRQLNKGENLHALKRSLAYAGEGAVLAHIWPTHHENIHFYGPLRRRRRRARQARLRRLPAAARCHRHGGPVSVNKPKIRL
jgi:hypothetical protein